MCPCTCLWCLWSSFTVVDRSMGWPGRWNSHTNYIRAVSVRDLINCIPVDYNQLGPGRLSRWPVHPVPTYCMELIFCSYSRKINTELARDPTVAGELLRIEETLRTIPVWLSWQARMNPAWLYRVFTPAKSQSKHRIPHRHHVQFRCQLSFHPDYHASRGFADLPIITTRCIPRF